MKTEYRRKGQITEFFLEDHRVLSIHTPETVQDIFEQTEDGVYRWTRKTQQAVDAMCMEAQTCFVPEHYMVPAVSYDGNPWGHDHEYKGDSYKGIPYTYAYHRCAIPGGTCSWNAKAGVAFFTQGVCSGSVYKMQEGDGRFVHRIIWPEVEEPRVLLQKGWGEAYYGTIAPRKEFVAWICIAAGEDIKRKMLHEAWQQNYRKQTPVWSTEKVWRESIKFAKLLYSEEDGFCAFNIGLIWDGEKWIKRQKNKYEIGWCGQNVSLAVSLLKEYEKTQDETARDMAERVLDSWVLKARSSGGVLLSQYDTEDSVIDACNMGTAGYQLFTAYDQAKKIGMEKNAWQTAAYEICDFIVKNQDADGCVGMSWNRDGSLYEKNGTGGAFLTLPLAEAYIRSQKISYLKSAELCFSYYYHEFIKRGYGTSGALDTCCIDKESVFPLLKSALLLHEITGQKEYIEYAENAAWYLSSWQWHHTVSYADDTILGKMGYDTFGGTSVSTSHHHMDPFAVCYVPELLQLSELTGCREWRERAQAIWCNGIQGISDGKLKIAPTAVRPAGSCDEGICQTRWGEREYPNEREITYCCISFGVSQWLVAWPCAFRLETIRRCEDIT